MTTEQADTLLEAMASLGTYLDVIVQIQLATIACTAVLCGIGIAAIFTICWSK